jgi:hypothetical protein
MILSNGLTWNVRQLLRLLTKHHRCEESKGEDEEASNLEEASIRLNVAFDRMSQMLTSANTDDLKQV